MLRAGTLRDRLAATLNAAYGDGLLSDATLAHRLELLFSEPLIEPARVTGDLTLRERRTAVNQTLTRLRGSWRRLLGDADPGPAAVLALDWSGGQEELLVGREEACDVVLIDPSVSRRHLRLVFADGVWSLRDLDSRNGTLVNETPVVRCRLHPGDRLRLGDQLLIID